MIRYPLEVCTPTVDDDDDIPLVYVQFVSIDRQRENTIFKNQTP